MVANLYFATTCLVYQNVLLRKIYNHLQYYLIMLKKISFAVLIVLLTISCSNKSRDKLPERKLLAATEIVADSLFTSFPGIMRVNSKHLILLCPFDLTENFLRVYDRQSGEEITRIGAIGQGPGEWITPQLANIDNNKLVVYDPNLKQYIPVSSDNLYQDISIYDLFRKIDILNPLSFVYLDSNRYIVANYKEQYPFEMASNGRISSCGKYPFDANFSNASGRLQGNVIMHPQKKILIYATSSNPYLAMYSIKDDRLDLMWENQFKPPQYSIVDNNLQWGDEQPDGVSDVAFTKDYIVCLVKDFKSEASGRDVKAAPKAIYVFDYNGRLIHILDLPFHSIRLASDAETNIFYSVALEPDYSIVEYDLSLKGL